MGITWRLVVVDVAWIFVLGGYVMGNDAGCAEFLVGTPRGFEE